MQNTIVDSIAIVAIKEVFGNKLTIDFNQKSK